MGNCLTRCFGKFDRKRRYLKAGYRAEREQSIEFETLMDDDNVPDDMSRGHLELTTGPFTVSSYVKWLAEREEDLKQEDESFYEAKHDAMRIAKLESAKERSAMKNAAHNGPKSLLADELDWEILGEDDLEIFLANVKARSLAARAQLYSGQGDCHSSSSSNAHTKDRSLTEGSSLDLEWDHEAGVEPVLQPRSHTEENLAELTSLHNYTAASSLHSSDLEWDDSFVSADDIERRQLLGMSTKDRYAR